MQNRAGTENVSARKFSLSNGNPVPLGTRCSSNAVKHFMYAHPGQGKYYGYIRKFCALAVSRTAIPTKRKWHKLLPSLERNGHERWNKVNCP